MIIDWLAHHARARGDALAAIDLGTGRRFSYRQFHDRVARLGAALRDQFAVRPGDRVMVLARNSTDIYEIMFACWRIGAAFMPINWRLAPPELAEIARDGDPTVIVADEEFKSALPAGRWRVLVRRPGDAASDYERVIAETAPDFSFRPASLDDMTTLLYTSGTTGRPKGVIGTWRMTTLTVMQTTMNGQLSADCTTLTAAPLFHTAGLNSYAMPLFHCGGTLAVMATWDPESALTYLSDPALKVTHTLGVPTQWLTMARHPLFQSATFPTVRLAACGGAPATTELMDTWAAKGLKLTPGYGMTECFGVTTMRAEVARRKPGAVGWPAIYTEIRIADDANRPVETGTVGEVQLKSPGVTPGYWRQPEATKAAFVDGWYKTGDLGYQDDEGLLFIVDRKKDMFISGGENVYPAEVENLLASFPEVGQVSVIGVTDPTWGEVGKAIVTARAGHTIDPAALLARCAGQIAKFKIPKSIVVVDSLPLSAQGKVLKTELRTRYG